MPSAIIHRTVAKAVLNKINLNYTIHDTYLYEVGSIAPDSWRNCATFKDSPLPKTEKRKYSHFSSSESWLEHYEIFYDKYKDYLNNPFMLGYFVHLITDHIAHKDIIYIKLFKNKSDSPNFNKEKSDALNSLLYKEYNLDELKQLSNEEINSLPLMDEFEYDGINKTIRYTNGEIKSSLESEQGDDSDKSFIALIDTWTNMIIEELKKYNVIDAKKKVI